MQRYVVRRPQLITEWEAKRKPKLMQCYDDDYWYDQPSPFIPMVYEDPDCYESTGLLDEDGNEILRFVGVLPIGFLADHSE